jgi:hypothetical protein
MSEILLDKLFVTVADFSSFREISKNITDEKVEIFIRESQLIEIRGFLGGELYTAMQLDFDETTPTFPDQLYTDLWYGVDYTYQSKEIRFNGYANSLVYFAYGRFLLQQQLNVSRFGLESLQDTISEDITTAQIRTKAKESLSVAIQYQQDTLAYLKANAASYPLYVQNETKPKTTSFTFNKL